MDGEGRVARIVSQGVVALLVLGMAGCAWAAEPGDGPGGTLPAFASQEALDKQLAEWRRRSQAEQLRLRARSSGEMAMPVPTPAPVAAAAPAADGAPAAGESITNVQVAGVDEGGIVKRHGDHLVVLRRGRLFTLRIGGDALAPVDAIDAFAPSTGDGAWYDEMLVSGDHVVVIGYSYARGGTEIGLFSIDRAGRLAYRETHHLSGNDYYSSRNYASRLIGDTLVFYTPLHYDRWGGRLVYPAIRRWRDGAGERDFRRILPATRIHRADRGVDPTRDMLALHTVTRCRLVPAMQCEASAVLGPAGRVFHVSAEAVHVWTMRIPRDSRRAGPPPGTLVRLPLDGSAPSAVGVHGAPIDALSFHEADGHLNVLLQTVGGGDAMWMPEWGGGRMALLRLPLARFGGQAAITTPRDYRLLPAVSSGERHNRYIGEWLLYGSAPWDGTRQSEAKAYALRYARGDAEIELAPGHGVERIEAMGRDAVLVGNFDDRLGFSAVALAPDGARIAGRWQLPGARQGESRTHGFFYRRDGERSGIVGLPVRRSGERAGAAVAFLRNAGLAWRPLGELAAQADPSRDDGCVASCVDWYGNARPIFLGTRVFALLGYELVEGRLEGEVIRERRRVDFAPRTHLRPRAD